MDEWTMVVKGEGRKEEFMVVVMIRDQKMREELVKIVKLLKISVHTKVIKCNIRFNML